MEQNHPASESAEMVAAELRKMEAGKSHLRDVLKVFSAILIEQVRWKAELSALDCNAIEAPDATRFGKGIPLVDRERLIRLGALWQTAAQRLIPPLKDGLPKIRETLERLQTAIVEGSFSPDRFLSVAFGGRESDAAEIAGRIDIEMELLGFVLTQMGKPVVERRAEVLQPLIKELAWNKGYCPVCGSPPGLSLLKEKEGQRWLRCGFCAHTWRFHRTTCPFCDNQEPGHAEFFFVEGCEHERVEVCHKCNKYILSLDLRSLANEVVLEVADIGLLHLDAIAQEKGFLPMQGSLWQGLGEESAEVKRNTRSINPGRKGE
jgi:FdhE protein